MANQKVLVTGMSGLIGGAVRTFFEDKCQLTALNRSDVTGVQTIRADIADFDDMRAAFDGQDTVIHLAAKSGENFTWEEFSSTNIEGTRNVFEAARQAGVKRVISASSGATVAGWELSEPYAAIIAGRYADVPEEWQLITHEMAPRPRGVYASTKVWGEALARHYTDSSDLSIINLRIGLVNEADRPLRPRHYAVWCSQRDLLQMIERCLDAPAELKFDTFFVVSDNHWNYRDLSHAREVLGFEPQDGAESYR
jgi:nucleoside-diphosphate-sugar epimerase